MVAVADVVGVPELNQLDRGKDRSAAAGRPFFIWHNNWGPHGPYFATREYVDMYRDVEVPAWPNYYWPARSIPGSHWNKIHPRQATFTWGD